jgi:hypothetical protein
MVFWWGWFMVALLAGGCLYAAWWARRNSKALAGQKPHDVSDLSEGYRLVWGRTVGPVLKAPLTGRSCVWWKAEVWESVREPDASGKFRHVWRSAANEESDRPLLFGDGKTLAAAWPQGATVVSSSWSDWRGDSLPPENRDPDLNTNGAPGQGIRHDMQGTFGPRFRYIEKIVAVDVPFFALGGVTRIDPKLHEPEPEEEYEEEPANERPGDRTAAEAEDLDVWTPEPSRLGLEPTHDDVIANDMLRATWSVSAVEKKPFLLSIEHPEVMGAEQELGAKGGLIMGAIFSALAIALLWLRLGG